MRPSYLVLRNETFHLRMRVPRPLLALVGSTELRPSLSESRRRAAALKAGYLAHEARSFFASLHRHMKHHPISDDAARVLDSFAPQDCVQGVANGPWSQRPHR